MQRVSVETVPLRRNRPTPIEPQGGDIHEVVQSLRAGATAPEATLLPELSSPVYAALEAWASAFPRSALAGQLPEARRLLSAPGQNPEDALRSLWGSRCQNAPPGLVESLESNLALRLAPTRKASRDRGQFSEAVISAFVALGYVLSARMILLLSMMGAFVLGVLAMRDPTMLRLFTLLAYACFAIVPVTLLELFGKRPKEG